MVLFCGGRVSLEIGVVGWMIFFLITTLICAEKWFSYKIGNLTILLYMAESGIELPDSETIEKYRKKVIKKLLNIKEF